MAYDFSGFLLGLLGAVLCPTELAEGDLLVYKHGGGRWLIDWYLGDAGGRDAI
jgi:hypothetical protein